MPQPVEVGARRWITWFRGSLQAQSITVLLVLVGLALTQRWWGPLPEFWSGYICGAYLAYVLCKIKERQRDRERVLRNYVLAQRLEAVTDGLRQVVSRP